jgi:glycosyltransferase involved in cell wall biosynthesis
MLIFDHEPASLHEGSTIYCLRYNKKNHFSCIKRVWQIVQAYDAVMIHAAHPVVLFPLLGLRKKSFVFQHGMSVSSGFWLQRILKKIWYSLVPILLGARVVCSTEFAFHKARRLGIFLRRKKCLIIPFGINLSGQSQKPNTRKPNGVIQVGMAGRLALQKRQDWVLQSLLSYSGDTKIHLKIAGDGPLLNDLKNSGKKIQNSNVVVEFLWNLNKECMKAFYNDLDLFVFPSKDESFGLVVLEALSHLVPVAVFSDVGGCLSVVQDRVNGFVLQDGIKGLEGLWKTLDKDPQILSEQRQFISAMDLREHDISHTRAKLDSLVRASE